MPWLQILLRAAVYFAASITVDQTFGISTALTQYFGPFPSYDYAAGYPPSTSEPVSVIVPIKLKDAYEIYPTTVLESQLRDINSSNRSESGSGVLAAEVVNILGVPHEIQLTANASDVREFARNVSMADSESTKAACLVPSHRWSWLYNLMGHDSLNKFFRALVMFLLCHDYVMNRAYVAFPTMTLVGGAMFYGWHFRVKSLRKIVRLSKKLSTAEGLTVNLMNNVTSAEARALEAEETKGQLQQQYSEAVILKDTSKREADAARNEADTARNAQEQAEQARKESTEAYKRACAALALADDEKHRLNVVSNAQEAALGKIRQENSELRDHDLTLRNEVDRITIASTTAVERSQKKSAQEIESLKKDKRDRDEKLKSQNQTTLKLRSDVRSLKDQLKELSPDGVEKLKKQLMAEEEARIAAEKKTRDLETEISKVEKERRTWAGEVGELKKKMEEAEEGRKAAEEKAVEMEAQKKEREAVHREQKSSDAATIVELKKEVEALYASAREAGSQTELLQAELTSAKSEMTGIQAARKASDDQLEQEKTNGDMLERAHTRAIRELQAQLEKANDKIRAQDNLLHDELEQAMTMLGTKDTAIANLETRLRDQASAIEKLETQVRDQALVIRGLETQSRDQAPNFSTPTSCSSTDSEGPDNPHPRPAVKLPGPGSSLGTPNDTNIDDDEAGFSIKGASGRQNSHGTIDIEAGSNASSDSQTYHDGFNKPNQCDNCHKFHEGQCLACSRCFRIHNGECGKRPTCSTCKKLHYFACREQTSLAFGSPTTTNPPINAISTASSAEVSKVCEFCGKIHGNRECWKWCKACEAVHYQKDCPIKNEVPQEPAQTPATADSTVIQEDSTPPSAPNTPRAASPDIQPRANSPATNPTPADNSQRPTAPGSGMAATGAGFALHGRGGVNRGGGRGRGNNFRGGPSGTRGARSGSRPERIDLAESFRRQNQRRGNWQG